MVRLHLEPNTRGSSINHLLPPLMNFSPKEATLLPGFGLPLNFSPAIDDGAANNTYLPPGMRSYRSFPCALNPNDIHDRRKVLGLTTLREFRMLQVMNHITDKHNWHKKIFNEKVAEKWRSEVKSQATAKDISQNMIDYIIDELRYKAGIYIETGAVSVYTGDVVKSDIAVPLSLKVSLQEAVNLLEESHDSDWHPGSDNTVLDLVHPSLFPLVYGETRVLEYGRTTLDDCITRSGEGIVAPVPLEEDTTVPLNGPVGALRRIVKNPYSRKFQWLPCEVDILGETPVITSHINNLHPERHKKLYRLIEQVIDVAIPLWDMSLAPGLDCKWVEHLRMFYHGGYRGLSEDIPGPEPGVFAPPSDPPLLNLRQRFIDDGLQIIVKLANIVLTPEKPEYKGGSWHVEGQMNEHICATALYYYSCENITPSRLSFRQQSDSGMAQNVRYSQDDHAWVTEIFGCDPLGSATQVIGGVETREGRLITFPNILQHQVQPFSLADRTRPGHRKILTLFLIDPHLRVLSTANVPPQQKDWWKEKIRSMRTGLDVLPPEVLEQVFDHVEEGFPMTLERAKELRLELMEERKVFETSHSSGSFESLTFSLCEH